MNPPLPRSENPDGSTDAPAPAGFALPIASLRKRGDFLAARGARHAAQAGLILQARKRSSEEPVPGQIRVGFTCSKKLGNAVRRNRAKRRLREVARLTLPGAGHSGWDYVLIGRRGATESRDFQALRADLEAALARVHRGARK